MIFDYLENAVRGREFLVGDTLSIADIAIACMLVNFEHARESLDRNRWPELVRYSAAIHARPSFQSSIAEERRFLERQRGIARVNDVVHRRGQRWALAGGSNSPAQFDMAVGLLFSRLNDSDAIQDLPRSRVLPPDI